MNGLKNKVTLIGHLGMDPEVKQTDGGHKLAKVSLATNESYKNNKGEKRKTAEFLGKYVHKGNEVVVEGKLLNRNYTDKAGIKKYVTEIQVNDVLVVGGKKSS
ncbi:MAG: single-stranded DNA-binding protein [Bacteroidetes bacterium]|nr:single-stranded DNA-binding protein [Bacteroidota bacterium]